MRLPEQAGQRSFRVGKHRHSSADGCISDAVAEAIGEAGEGMLFSGPDIAFSGGQYEVFKCLSRDGRLRHTLCVPCSRRTMPPICCLPASKKLRLKRTTVPSTLAARRCATACMRPPASRVSPARSTATSTATAPIPRLLVSELQVGNT